MGKLAYGVAAAMAILGGAANAQTVYGVDERNNLITFSGNAPGTVTSSVAITGASGFQAIDFRPINNTLYGLGGNLVIYSINLTSGLATAVSNQLALTGTQFAFDFNPTIDRLRIVSDTNQNYVFNPTDGFSPTALTTATPVFYAAGDANEGADPAIAAAAYTTSVFGAPGTSTQLYSIDTAADVLVRQANSMGILNTVGGLGRDLEGSTSFDILGNSAFVANGGSLFSIDLMSGGLTEIGMTDRSLVAIAIGPVPEPATWAMMIGGFGMIGGALRHRRRLGLRLA